MKTLTAFSVVLLGAFAAFAVSDAAAQDIPLVYPEEEMCPDCQTPYFPSFGDLPKIPGLPDPFMWSDGRGRIHYFSDWEHRRAEIKAALQHYEIGEKPTESDSLNASFEDGTLTVDVWVNGHQLTLTSAITLPEGEGPFPVAIGMGGLIIPDSIFANRNIARMNFNFAQVMQHTQMRGSEPINDLYPDLKYMGAYSAWPWGVSRLIDGLEMIADQANLDLEHLAVSGCSFAGKMAIFSGALDERVALTFGIESGGGGYTTWRYSEVLDRIEPVERLGRTDHTWFIEDMFQFANDVDRLPIDHHELMAMVAPRALFVTGNPGYVWLADESGYVGSNATKKVYEALGASDRFGYSQIGGHNHCAVPAAQIPEIVAFVDKFLLGVESADTEVATSSYTTNLDAWIPWEAPTLTEGTSFFGRTNLSAPEDGASGLDTSVDFSWEEYEGAQQYYFQLSKTGSFSTIAVEDSTTGTELSVDSLGEGRRYYWRIRVRNSEGSLGPWTNPFGLTTFVELPAEPMHLQARIARPSRPNALYFEWGTDPQADTYRLEVAPDDTFQDPYSSISTSDTSRTMVIVGVFEGDAVFWRVSAQNLAGSGPWSPTMRFFILAPPDDLELDITSPTEIKLTWDDNSDIEEGYIIERKGVSDESFSVIDTLAADSREYIDSGLGEDDYMYRVKAYVGEESSDYSETVSTVVTSSETEPGVPRDYSLSQNYPNPFNPSTRIEFALPNAVRTRVAIYDVLGRQVDIPLNEVLAAGDHEFTFDASDLPSGVYLYQIEAGDFVQTKRMILIK